MNKENNQEEIDSRRLELIASIKTPHGKTVDLLSLEGDYAWISCQDSSGSVCSGYFEPTKDVLLDINRENYLEAVSILEGMADKRGLRKRRITQLIQGHVYRGRGNGLAFLCVRVDDKLGLMTLRSSSVFTEFNPDDYEHVERLDREMVIETSDEGKRSIIVRKTIKRRY